MELRQALAALNGGEFQGVAFVGDSGVGKSTLARTLAKVAEHAGRTVRFALGTHTGSAVPLGVFSRAVTLNGTHEPALLLASAHKTLSADKNLVVLVDDAQLLDPLSATLVNQLVASRTARLIVTIRSGESVFDAVTALLKERLLLTVHVDPFTREQTETLAGAVLDGAVEPRLVDELQVRSAGNPLVLRGLLSASREDGVLIRTEDCWERRGPLHADRELYDLLEFRLRSLSLEELEVVEVLATAEVLEWDILRGICDADVAAGLERRGLMQLVVDGSHTLAQLNHPLLGDAATRHAGVVRSRQLNGILAQALQKHLQSGGHSHLADMRSRIRLAQFMVRSDLAPDLDVVIEAAADALAMSNIALGEELARFAVDRGGGLLAALVLAEAVSWQGRGDEAETALVDAEPEGDADEWLIARWGCLRAANLFWGCERVEAAQQVLTDVRCRVASKASTDLIDALQLSIGLFCGDVAKTMEVGPKFCESDVPPIAIVWAAVPTCIASAAAGRYANVHYAADAGLNAAALEGLGLQRFNIGMAEIMNATEAGEYQAAERILKRYKAIAACVPAAEAMVHTMRGFVQLYRGDLSAASSAFKDSKAIFSQGFPSPWLMLATARHAQAEGQRGDSEAAAAALRSAEEAYGPHVAVFLPELELARAWQRASAGETTSAQVHAIEAAQVALEAGMYAVEMRALHAAVRLGDPAHATRLQELAGILKTPLAETVASHARGLARHDGGLVDAAAHRFADLGALALAADASAQAAGEHTDRGERGKRTESSTYAYSMASQCGLRTPAFEAAARPLPFSDRERQVALLVVAGLSNRQIADQLFVSVRTVEGHLYRLFTKLGINNRDQLIHLIGRQPAVRSTLSRRCDKRSAQLVPRRPIGLTDFPLGQMEA
ncbi:LuxR C-terminal-related transcriptional regulator [Mycobacterium sp.]|jgi:DNA-binding CsgD family transcriptional regulator/energy-coupling factor transporter ATP-binding protein EcfA2|uniref:LuxR C-terminal-related transcriptional regulator n=1 Tax=Mycobacterium sp. TaxID=1785 RepID=UPI0028BD9910|nr:LuxR C-terminal-related transcriptional regulator [Mycobacterium sp.]